jgi:phenylacetate-CoA ligase
MWQYTEIEQYQLIQEDKKRYTIKINCREPFTREQKLIEEFKSYLGQDADFRIEYVTEIPLLSSGKRKKIVNNYTKV